MDVLEVGVNPVSQSIPLMEVQTPGRKQIPARVTEHVWQTITSGVSKKHEYFTLTSLATDGHIPNW